MMDLTPITQSAASFAQQGTVDWTALSQNSFTATLAILGRLSAEGVEPLTAAMAQAVCTKLPIGIHGEKQLKEAMLHLKSFSSFGEVLWFGFGIRHILRTIVQSAEGASSVALAASLAEGFSIEYSANVLYDIVKALNGPAELSPSYDQWQKYVQMCSGIFATSMFSRRIEQLARNAGFVLPGPLPSSTWDRNRAPSPKALARILCAIGEIQRDCIESIEIIGGSACCWIAVFCDLILGLRIQVRAANDEIISENFLNDRERAQVVLRLSSEPLELYCAGRVFTLPSANHLFSSPLIDPIGNSRLLRSAIERQTIISSFFGDLINQVGINHFADLLAACATVYCSHFSSRHPMPNTLVEDMVDLLPELSPLLQPALKQLRQGIPNKRPDMPALARPNSASFFGGMSCFDVKLDPGCRKGYREDWCLSLFEKAFKNIRDACPCDENPRRCSTFASCITVIFLGYLLSNVVFDDDIPVSRTGLRKLYEGVLYRDVPDILSSGCVRSYLFLRLCRSALRFSDSFTNNSLTLLSIFTGYVPEGPPHPHEYTGISAMSYHGLYCYFDILREPFQRYEDATRIHLGRGSIKSGARTYNMVFDHEHHGSSAQGPIMSSVHPHARAMVEENIILKFWYEYWSGNGFNHRCSFNPRSCIDAKWDKENPFCTDRQAVATGFGYPIRSEGVSQG